MLNPGMISKFLMAQRHGQLLEALVSNGLFLPVAMRQAVAMGGRTPVLGLGLRRMLELARRPMPWADPLLAELLNAQASDGSFEHDPLATAIALAALRQAIADLPATPGQKQPLEQACRHAVSALEAMQDENGCFQSSQLVSRAEAEVLTAYILQLLCLDARTRTALGLDRLLHLLESRRHLLDGDARSCLRIARACMRPAAAAAAA